MGSSGDFGVHVRNMLAWPERRKREIGRIASIAVCGFLTSAALIGAARATDPVASAGLDRVAYLPTGAVDKAVENADGFGSAARAAETAGRSGRLPADASPRQVSAGWQQDASGTASTGLVSAVSAGLQRVAYLATGATGMASVGEADRSGSAARSGDEAGRSGRQRADGQPGQAAANSRLNASGTASTGLISAVTAGLERVARLFNDAAATPSVDNAGASGPAARAEDAAEPIAVQHADDQQGQPTASSLQNAPGMTNASLLSAVSARPEQVAHLVEAADDVASTARPEEAAGPRLTELPKQVAAASRRDAAGAASASVVLGESVGAGIVHLAAATDGPSVSKMPVSDASARADGAAGIATRPRSAYQLAPVSQEPAANSELAAPIRVAQSQNQNQRRSFGVIVTEDAVPQRVVVTLHKSRTFRMDRPFKTAAVGSSEIADLQPMTDRILYIQGKRVGTTNVSIFDEDSRLIGILDVEVTPDTANLREKIRAGTGAGDIQVSSANGQIVLTGMAADATVADRVVSVASGMAGSAQIINAMQVAAPQQVMLEVRFLEASRGAGRELGVNLEAWGKSGRGIQTGFGSRQKLPTAPNPELPSLVAPIVNVAGTLLSGSPPFGIALARLFTVNGTNVDALISALEDKGLVRKLAEPNLIALSGDKASFLAGGEFPVPIPSETSGGTASTKVEFKRFGVELEFTPTVLAKGQINLQIAPSVSELDHSSSVRIGDILVPGLTKRTARTTVELRDGQSFAIAGLLQSSNRRNTAQVPWIGSVPVLGALFRSAEFQQEETDLVIIVTPRLVQPAAPGQRLASPLDSRLPGNDVDFFLNGQPEVKKRYFDYVTAGGGVEGPYGHMIEPEYGYVPVSTSRKAVSGK